MVVYEGGTRVGWVFEAAGRGGGYDAAFQHFIVPGGCAFFAAEDEFEGRVGHFDRFGPLEGFFGVGRGCVGEDLPGAPDLVPEGPVLDVVGFRVAVGAAEVRVVRVLGSVAVFEPGEGFVEGAGAHVEAEVGLDAWTAGWGEGGEPGHEFVGAELVRLDVVPGEVGAARAEVLGPDPVLPVVGCGEVAARVADHWDGEGGEGREDVFAEAA